MYSKNPYQNKTKEEILQITKKRFDSCMKNNSYNKSDPEEIFYHKLLCFYSKDDIKRQYHSDEYPFNCDFYVISENTYIEINMSHYHHGHPFNCHDNNDIKELNNIKSKQCLYLNHNNKETKNQYYAIEDTWPVRDINKLNTAINNKLNYLMIYPDNLIIYYKNGILCT